MDSNQPSDSKISKGIPLFVLIILVIVVVVSLFLFQYFLQKSNKKVISTLPDTVIPLTVTSVPSTVPSEPLVFFNGTLKKIEGDTIVLSYLDEKTSATSSATFLIGKNTQISNSTVTPFFYFISPTPAKSQKTDKNSLKIKDRVMVAIKEGDRGSSKKPVEAVFVDITSGPFYAFVKIAKIEGNVLTIERLDTLTNYSSPTLITINKDTEIIMMKSGSSAEIPTKEDYSQITMSDLKADMQVDIYTEINLVSGDENNALQIKVRNREYESSVPSVVTPTP